MRDSELRESVKIVKEEEEREYICFKEKMIVHCLLVITLDSGGRVYLNV